jgi:hypothetical protein
MGSYAGRGNASLLIEKAKGGLHRSTPDSETLASSDDELDQRHHHFPSNQQQQLPRSTRQASWFSKIRQGPPRKASIIGAYSTAGSNPAIRESPTTQLSSFQRSWARVCVRLLMPVLLRRLGARISAFLTT